MERIDKEYMDAKRYMVDYRGEIDPHEMFQNVKQMDAYLEQMPAAVFCPTDYSSGPFTIAADFIRSRFGACRSYPVKKRLKLIADDIHAHFTSDHLFLDNIPNRGAILKVLGACSISPQQEPCTG